MIVLDASAALDLLLGSRRAVQVGSRIATESIHVPHLIDIEIVHVLRRHTLALGISVVQAQAALDAWENLDIERHAHDTLLPRIWSLRTSLTGYDAAYVALAEALASPLLTCDARLANSHGHQATIELA